MRTTLCILLIIGLALGLAAKPTAPKNEDKDDTDVDIDAPLTDEEEAILERLVNDGVIKEEDLVDAQPDDVEVDLEPAQESSVEANKKSSESVVKGEMKEEEMLEQPDEEEDAALESKQVLPEEVPVKAEAPKQTTPEDERAKKAAIMLTEGEREFMTFTDPEYSARAMRDTPTVDVKRSRELRFTDDNAAGITKANMIFIGIVGVCAVVAMMGTVVAGVAYYKLHKQHIAVQRGQGDYSTRERRHISAHGLDKRSSTRSGDAKNAYSAQLHHYQQTKSEIIRIQQAEAQHGHESDESDADDNEEPDYSVYECPGLAPTGDIEVANPMFDATQKR